MRRIYYGFLAYKYDVLAAIVSGVLAYAAYRYVARPENGLIFSLIFIVLFLIVVIYLRNIERDFYYIEFSQRQDKDDWIGKGSFDYVRSFNCFSLTNSGGGYIYSKCLNWEDYKISFDFKIQNSCLGVVLRAENLSNYIMLQVGQKKIVPHLKINGGWNVRNDEADKLTFNNPLELDKWYKAVFICDKNSVNILINENGKTIFQREWIIPEGYIVIQFGQSEQNVIQQGLPFPIDLEYGSVGFRNFGNEKALIKNFLIQKI